MTVLVSFIRNALPRRDYQPTDRSYRATMAPLGRRFVAGLVDWSIVTVCYLLVNIPLGVLQVTADEVGGVVRWVGLVLTQMAALAVVAGYFAFFFSTGHTLGMRAADIHVVEQRSGKAPALARAATRGVLAVVFFLASFTAYTYLLGHYDSPLSSFHQGARVVSITVAALAAIGHLVQLRDRQGRSLWDRLAGLAVVEDIVPSSMPDRLWAPWGP
jgi:uncharacterized RDD family membrane protein YckC